MSLHEKVMDMIGIKWDCFTRKIIRYLINWKPIKFKKMPVFYICNFTGCFTTWALMYNAFFLQMSPDAIKKHLSIIAFEAPSDARNWVFILLRKFMKNFSVWFFFLEQIYLHEPHVIIYKCYKPSFSWQSGDLWSPPSITMYYWKWLRGLICL